MIDRQTRRIVISLLLVSALIYACQILIFREPRTTFFYLLQDCAFLPATVAIATVVVGQVLSERERRERMEKTRMLTSAFYTEIGGQLMGILLAETEKEADLRGILIRNSREELSLEEAQRKLREARILLRVDEDAFYCVKRLILEHRTALLVISSNPLLLENESFTELLWGIFHLTDEFRLRGDFPDLPPAVQKHLNQDMEKVLRLLLLNWVGNVRYLKKQYPDFYKNAVLRLIQERETGTLQA